MTMHPELKHALDTNLSVLEVIRLFARHHSGVPEERIESCTRHETHNDCSFWDDWQPLFHKLYSSQGFEPFPVSQAFLSIHKNLTREVISWLCDSGRRSNVYLIEEAQTRTENVDETFRANAFASICYDAHRFGLPRLDPPGCHPNISAICATLAEHYPLFRRILAEILFDNTEIHNLPTRTRFKKLIYEPWKSLQISHPQYVAAPPVIVLRWYGRTPWLGDEEGEELLRSIYELASSPHALPLLWIISFSPKLKLPILDLLDSSDCPRLTRVPVRYSDAYTDTELFLRRRFSILRQKHKEIFADDEVWPSDEQMRHLTRIFSGTFDAVDVVTQFVDWEGDGGPKAHLETFLAYMIDSPPPSDKRPYCAIDHFYTRSFSNIPPDLLPVAKRILSVCYWEYNLFYVTSFGLTFLLSLGHDVVLSLLRHLCRWAVISDVQYKVVSYKPSCFFKGFLEDRKRSRHFNIRKSEISNHIYEVSLRIICHYSNPSELLKPVGRSALKAHGSEIKEFIEHALSTFYHALDPDSHLEWILRHFDFGCLAHSQSALYCTNFIFFIERLYAWGKDKSPNIVRVKPSGPLDSQFVEKCEGLAEPFDLEEKGDWWELRPTGPKYVLLGHGAGTVLVVLATDTVRNPLGEPRFYGCCIYTSAMLEYM